MRSIDSYIGNMATSDLINIVRDNMIKKDDQLLQLLLNIGYQKGRNDLLKILKSEFRPVRAVYSNVKDRRLMKIKELIGEDKVVLERVTRNEIRFETLTDIYIGLPPNDSTRGNKNHYVYIDKAIEKSHEDIIRNVIIPSTIVAHQVYPEGQKYKRRDHFEYFTFEKDCL